MQTIRYPVRGRTMEDVFTQELVEQLAHQMELWQQGPGVIGALHLNGCWGEASVLDKRYQGETIFTYDAAMEATTQIYNVTKQEKWRVFANNIACNLLYLQAENGGLRHGSNEFEPTFDPESTCPMHQSRAILALLTYAAWEHADEYIKSRIKPAIDRHWQWFNNIFWLRGNAGVHPFPYNAGWCGVSNQDLTVVRMLATYGKVYGDWSRYETYGKPCLDDYLEHYYYKEIGLFERGDSRDHNFTERTHYNGIILNCLDHLYQCTGDPAIPPVIENVTAHLFDAAFVGGDGCTHMAWGAVTDPVDKTVVKGWNYAPITPSYLGLLPFMERYLQAHPDAEKQKIFDSLQETFCGYVYADGAYPIGFQSKNPYFSIISRVDYDFILIESVRRMGDRLQPLKTPEDICIHRKIGNYTWKQKGKWWAIEENGVRRYGGYTGYMAGVTIGPDEPAVCGSYDVLEQCDLEEIVEY